MQPTDNRYFFGNNNGELPVFIGHGTHLRGLRSAKGDVV
jgi:hypothetical protein